MYPYSYYKKQAQEALNGNALKAASVGLLMLLLTSFINIYFSVADIENILMNIAGNILSLIFILSPFSMGAAIFYLKLGRGEKPSVGVVFDGYKYMLKLIPYIVINLLISLAGTYFDYVVLKETTEITSVAGIAGAICDIVSILAGLYFSFTFYILYDNKGISGIKAMIKSIKILKGNIIYFIGLQLSFIFWIIAAVFTFGTLLLYLEPYMEITIFKFYEELIKPKPESEDIIEGRE